MDEHTVDAAPRIAVADGNPKRFSRRIGLRMLLGVPAALTGLIAMGGKAAEAAPLTDPWKLGGNIIAADGTNFLGTLNVAPIIFKTKATASGTVTEKARITPTGAFGVGVDVPAGKIHSKTGGTGVLGESLATVSAAAGVLGKVTNASAAGDSAGVMGTNAVTGSSGSGVKGTHAGGGSGVIGLASGNGYGLNGSGGYCGAYGSGGSYGAIFYGNNSGAYGAYASGNNTGLYAVGNSYGVQGAGGTDGVYGSGGSNGVYGTGPVGVYGSGTSYGVQGYVNGNGAPGGVRGDSNYRGVMGYGTNSGLFGSSGYVGTWTEATGVGGYAVFANASATTGQNYGIYAQSGSPAGFAGWFAGNVHVTGSVSKAAGSFKIDHPLDPDNKYLSHSFVESPDMLNVYNGNVTTDTQGSAVVTLPDYFAALNRDFRYQLTVIGQFAQAIVASKIQGNRFTIKTDKPNVEVSWLVTGIRQDAYALAHPIVVEEDKPSAARGKRLTASSQAGQAAEFAGPDSDVRVGKIAPPPASPAAVQAPARLAPPAPPVDPVPGAS